MAISLVEITAGEFELGKLPIACCIIASGCFWFLRGKLPMATGEAPSDNKLRDAGEILIGLWPILAVILMAVGLKMQIFLAAAIILVLYAVAGRFSFRELKPVFAASLQPKLYLNTFAAMQMSPTHICLTLTADYFEIPLGTLIRKTLPAVVTTELFAIAYYLTWTTVFS